MADPFERPQDADDDAFPVNEEEPTGWRGSPAEPQVPTCRECGDPLLDDPTADKCARCANPYYPATEAMLPRPSSTEGMMT